MMEIVSQNGSIQGFACSRQGGRAENQDDWGFCETPLGFLLVVCDGMGGGPGGKTASMIAKHELATAIQVCSPQGSRIDAMKMAVSRANEVLYRRMDENPNLRGMGSTLVAILVNPQSAIVAHLGDSRCYRVSKGHVVFRTTDHSLVGELVLNKAMTEEQARLSPQSNVITRGLGNTSNHVPEIEEIAYCKGDRFFLCTDGVWGIMPHEQLTNRLTSIQDIGSLVSNLSAEVDQIGFSTGGNHDNHTLAAIEMKTDSILKDKMSKRQRTMMLSILAALIVSIVFNLVCLLKLGKMPQIKELERTLSELERKNQSLETSMALYEDVKNGSTEDLMRKVEILEYEKELLDERQVVLIEKIDSLERLLAESKVKKDKPATTKTVKTSKSEGYSAQEIAQHIINLFKAMESAKGDTWKEAAKKKAEYRQQIIEQLIMLDTKTKGKYGSSIQAINRVLQHPSPLTDKVARNMDNKSKEEYVSTGAAVNEIRKLSMKVSEIKKKIKTQ